MERHNGNGRALIPAAGYIRMSSAKQERSPAQQRAEIERLAKAERCEIVAWFADEAITGDSGPDRRPGFGALLDAADRREFQVVIAENIDRLGRFDSLQAAEHYNRLRRAGVRIITAADGPIDLDTFEGRLVQTVKQEGKHSFLRDLSRKVCRGGLANAKAGNRNGGKACYAMVRVLVDEAGEIVRTLQPGERVTLPGHRVRLAPGDDPAKLAAVRYAFRRYAESDIGQVALAAELSERGYPSPSGRPWSGQAVRLILRNPAYVGRAAWGRRSVGRYHRIVGGQIEPKNGVRGAVAGDPILVKRAHKGIVSVKLFDQVQRKLEARRGAPRRRSADYPLSGLIFCGSCGRPMSGWTQRRASGTVYHRYVCSTYQKWHRRNEAGCGYFHVDAERVLGWLVPRLQEVFLGPGRAELVEAIKRQLRAGAKEGRADRRRLEARAAELDAEIARLIGAVRRLDDPGLVESLRAARVEQRRIKDALQRVIRPVDSAEIHREAERTADEVWRLGDALRTADPAVLRELLRRAVSRITCEFQKGEKNGRTLTRLLGGVVEVRDPRLVSSYGLHGLP